MKSKLTLQKALALLLSVIMIIGVMPMFSFAADDHTHGTEMEFVTASYKYHDKVYTCCGEIAEENILHKFTDGVCEDCGQEVVLIQNVLWDGTVARWDSLDGADSYVISLYENGLFTPVRNENIGNVTSYDFTEYIDTESGIDHAYTFVVYPEGVPESAVTSDEYSTHVLHTESYYYTPLSIVYHNKRYSCCGAVVSEEKHVFAGNERTCYLCNYTVAVVTGLRWNGMVAEWDEYENADTYQVTLYKNNKSMGFPSIVNTATSIDYTNRITSSGSGSYVFKVMPSIKGIGTYERTVSESEVLHIHGTGVKYEAIDETGHKSLKSCCGEVLVESAPHEYTSSGKCSKCSYYVPRVSNLQLYYDGMLRWKLVPGISEYAIVLYKGDGSVLSSEIVNLSDCYVDESSCEYNFYEKLEYWGSNEYYINVAPICENTYSEYWFMSSNTINYTAKKITLSGTFTSYGDDSETVILLINDSNADVSYEVKALGTKTDAKYTGTWSIEDVQAGTYTVRVSKKNHVTREYTITASSDNGTIDVQINPIGDISGDGKVTTVDVVKVNSHLRKTEMLTGYQFDCADVTDDGKIMTIDVVRLNAHLRGTNMLW